MQIVEAFAVVPAVCVLHEPYDDDIVSYQNNACDLYLSPLAQHSALCCSTA